MEPKPNAGPGPRDDTEAVGQSAQGRTIIEMALLSTAVAFAAAAVISALAPVSRIQLGPVRVSLADTSRVAFQASLVGLVATLAWSFERGRRLAVTLAISAVITAAVADSFPRRVGDGAEYVAMAMNILRVGRPALSAGEKESLAERLAHTQGFEESPLEGGPVGVGGLQDYPHFWLYSVTAVPFMALTETVGVHPAYAFTAVNIVLVMALVWTMTGRGDCLLAALFAAGPLVWWLDKAHAEVFLAVLIATSVYCFERWPGFSVAAAALASTQHPAAAGLLAIQAIRFLVAEPGTATRYLPLLASLVIAALNPAYYCLRLGSASPLLESDSIALPGLRAFLTPLVDPNLGLVFYAPVFCLAVAVGLVVSPRRAALSCAAIFVVFLAAFTQTHNVNHGGTPGMSRYALWLIAAGVAVAATSLRLIDGRKPLVATLAIGLTAITSWTTFRPALAEQQRDSPSAIAAALWRHWPAVDAPVPEVFAERSSGMDGTPPVPVSNSECTKVLVRGDGVDAVFPFPCDPLEAPPWCSALNALCYVNNGRFSSVPVQQGFGWAAHPERSWTVRTKAQFAALRTSLGTDARVVRLGGKAQRVVAGTGVSQLWVVEGADGAAAWVYPLTGSAARLMLRLAKQADLHVRDSSGSSAQPSVRLEPGDHVVVIESEADTLAMLIDARPPG